MRMGTGSRAQSFARSQQDLRVRQTMGSRQNSVALANANFGAHTGEKADAHHEK